MLQWKKKHAGGGTVLDSTIKGWIKQCPWPEIVTKADGLKSIFCHHCEVVGKKNVMGGEKLGYPPHTQLRVVLECDGTEVEDETYFQTVDKDTVFLLLRPNEHWLPPSVETLRAAIRAIPQIVCEAINSLELVDRQPSWKIMDNKGQVTVVLHWDQRDFRGPSEKKGRYYGRREPVWRVEVTSQEVQTVDQTTATFKDIPGSAGPHTRFTLEDLGLKSAMRMLPKKTHVEHGASPDHDHSLCDFHCSALHEEGAQIILNKSVATSPIQEMPEGAAAAAGPSGVSLHKKGGAKGHVRFLDEAQEVKSPGRDESESDTENTTNEEEQLSEHYLLLTDQLSLEQNRHLNIRDIGVILDRLSSKIVEVQKLEREKESAEIHNWTIKATIRGEVLREIGVIYNGQYYGIMEHPGYF
ncbi:uncharacterized protein LOC106470363 [Limulus polyphemus]|uniref:Uncharacterized protein LOC106470363 n=1 Tax=Limulus polyphemus TaxID=6850 RepID=A0ABM1TFM0_LIMPO|nr:uncharacterized protein LOC106470363 [Limulus polyphemus]